MKFSHFKTQFINAIWWLRNTAASLDYSPLLAIWGGGGTELCSVTLYWTWLALIPHWTKVNFKFTLFYIITLLIYYLHYIIKNLHYFAKPGGYEWDKYCRDSNTRCTLSASEEVVSRLPAAPTTHKTMWVEHGYEWRLQSQASQILHLRPHAPTVAMKRRIKMTHTAVASHYCATLYGTYRSHRDCSSFDRP